MVKYIVGIATDKIGEHYNWSPGARMFAGITVGALTYGGLNNLDKGFNMSGLNVKPKINSIDMEPGKAYDVNEINFVKDPNAEYLAELGQAEIDAKKIVAEIETDPVRLARGAQGFGKYPYIDEWSSITYNKGDILYRGEPNGTEFFTTREAIDSVGASQAKLFDGLQVEPHPKFGFRKEMQGYIFNDIVYGAEAKCRANYQIGNGGLSQGFVPNANILINQGILSPVDKIVLKGID